MANTLSKFRWGYRFAALCGIAIIGAQLQALDCSHPLDRNCETAPSLTEMPLGTADGRNTVFVLRSVPSNAAPVAVFVNGVPLASTDYVLQDRKITFPPERAPQAGDNIQVSYVPLPGRAGSGQDLQNSNANGSELGLNKNDELTRAAIREALDTEAKHLDKNFTKAERSRQQVPSIRTDSSETRTLSSLKLLSSQLRRNSRNDRQRQPSRSARAVETAGIDGLGDTLPLSSLELQSDFSEDSSRADENLRLPGPPARLADEGSDTGPSSTPSLASLRLLGRRLHENKNSRSRTPQEQRRKKKREEDARADSPRGYSERDDSAQ